MISTAGTARSVSRTCPHRTAPRPRKSSIGSATWTATGKERGKKLLADIALAETYLDSLAAKPEHTQEARRLQREYRDLRAKLTAQWLEGKIASVPGCGGGPDEETEALIPVLAACNRAGFVTTVSRPGEEPTAGYDGELWTQRAAGEGFAAAATLEALRSHTAGTRLILIAAPADRPEPEWQTQIPVTLDDDRENTWFGSLLARRDIEDADKDPRRRACRYRGS